MISWLRECDQYFTPEERTMVASALWECVEQYGQGLRAYAAIDLRDGAKAMQEAVEKIIYSNVDEIVVGGLLLKEAARELTAYTKVPQKDYPQDRSCLSFWARCRARKNRCASLLWSGSIGRPAQVNLQIIFRACLCATF
jgi:hypothetical protein